MSEISIQAAADGTVVAKETLKAYHKNVLANCYGELIEQIRDFDLCKISS